MPFAENLECSGRRFVPILIGPTAVGKSDFAWEWVKQKSWTGIIQVDSVTVYRFFEVGAAKPSWVQREEVPHFLIDVCDPDQPYTAADFVRQAHALLKQGGRFLLCGGSVFYLRAFLGGLWETPGADQALREGLSASPNEALFEELRQVDPDGMALFSKQDRYRLIRAVEILRQTGHPPSYYQKRLTQTEKQPSPFYYRVAWVDRSPEELHKRVKKRTQGMLAQGLIQEYQTLEARFPQAPALKSVGYEQVRQFLKGEIPQGRKKMQTEADLQQEIELATLQLIKKQRTAFRSLIKILQQQQIEFASFRLEEDRAALEDYLNSPLKPVSEL